MQLQHPVHMDLYNTICSCFQVTSVNKKLLNSAQSTELLITQDAAYAHTAKRICMARAIRQRLYGLIGHTLVCIWCSVRKSPCCYCFGGDDGRELPCRFRSSTWKVNLLSGTASRFLTQAQPVVE